MIVATGHSDGMLDVPVDLRFIRTGEHDEPVFFLAFRDKLLGFIQRLAVLAMAGRVTVCHKRHDAQAGYSRLRVIQRWKRAIDLLLCNEKRQARSTAASTRCHSSSGSNTPRQSSRDELTADRRALAVGFFCAAGCACTGIRGNAEKRQRQE